MKRATVYHHIDLILPDHIADWDVLDYWEMPRWSSLNRHLTATDRLWMVGAEHGFVVATYTQFLDPALMVLIEPSPQFWPNIRKTWESNGFAVPHVTIEALIADVSSGDATVNAQSWPESSVGPECGAMAYRYVHNNVVVPVATIDELVGRGVTPPHAIAMDIEGAEVLALRGAYDTLRTDRPLLWVSVHPDLIERDYAPHTVDDLWAYMGGLDYHRSLIAIDHEEHWFFQPKEQL